MKISKLTKSLLFLLCLVMPLSSCKGGDTSSSTNNSTNSSFESNTNVENSTSSENEQEIITIAEAIAIANAAGSTLTEEEYLIKGTIETVSNSTYGEMTVKDETGSLFIYGVFDKDRETRYDALEDKPVAGDEIVLLGKLKMYYEKPEMDRGYMQSFRHVDVSENVDLTQYAEKSIKETRELEKGSKVKVSGTVAKITYATGMKPNGFYLVGDESSIYVYSGDLAAQVTVGNNIQIAAEKTYWILDTETSFAEKYGYNGACQLDNAYLISNDKKVNDIDLSWCEDFTVKGILDTPVTENITTNIFKVNAYVKKQQNPGFVNYYIDDLDGKTGSYCYTQCNGADYSWLDEFDGEICTVYLSPINCKSTASGCVYRFVPIKVVDEDFTFDVANAPKFAIDYYVKDQFYKEYTADPSLEVISSVSQAELGFENVEITYSSSDEEVAYFTGNVFHTKNHGTANITVKATYQSYSYEDTFEVVVNKIGNVEYTNVKGAIDANDGEEVTVKGIVASSLVNKTGFYLVDETGLIAVQISAADLSLIELGNEVIVKGTRDHAGAKTKSIGQSNIANAELVANLYGHHEYSTATFDNTKTVEDLYDLDEKVDYSTNGYVVKGTAYTKGSNYSSTVHLKGQDDSKAIRLYCSGAGQYSFLNDYYNQELTFEVAVCNWNDKDYYTGCIIAVILEDGTRVVNNLHFAN